MDPSYLNPRTGETFPLDQPRWCGTDRAPLLLTSLPGITRARSIPPRAACGVTAWRCRSGG